MKIVYHCFGGSHSSVTAAAIHLGILSSSRLPTVAELLRVPFFDEQLAENHGIFHFIGDDEFGNQVYIVGRRNLGRFFEPLMYGIARTMGISDNELLFVNTMPCVNWLMVVGGFLSRRLRLVPVGRPIVLEGTRRSFHNFVKLVDAVKTSKLVQRKVEVKGNQP